MTRLSLFVFFSLLVAAPASAQTAQEIGQMRLYIQDLEERVRQLTGQNEQLTYELNQLRTQLGQAPLQQTPLQPGPEQTGAVTQPPAQQTQTLGSVDLPPGAPPQDLGTLSVSPNDPLISPDGVEAPVDLSVFAGGAGEQMLDPQAQPTAPQPTAPQTPVQQTPAPTGDMQTAGLPQSPPTTSLSGSPRDEYDLAYGYILTGDYGLAEESFTIWLANFPNDPQAIDAQFWLGESHLQQGEYQEAANAFLAVYKMAPDSMKAPDALLKLGMSLAALGEANAACATFAEVGRKFPQASEALMSRVRDEEGRAGC